MATPYLMPANQPPTAPTLECDHTPGGISRIRIGGNWSLHHPRPEVASLSSLLDEDPKPSTIEFDMARLGTYDSSLIALLVDLAKRCQKADVPLTTQNIPEGVRELIKLALAVPEKQTRAHHAYESFFTRLGKTGLSLGESMVDVFAFLGETSLALTRAIRGKAIFRWSDTWLIIQRAGAEALPIVTLINLLVGIIIAFVGVIQLQRFGASIFMADLVGIGMVRELGCIMTGIIMSGRTGAAFAAEIGSMKVSQEIDALKTLGFSPMDFLVLPRVIALVLMLPLLTAFGNVMGMLGGAIIAPAFDVSLTQYYHQLVGAVNLPNYLVGLVKSLFFGAIIASAGCLKGMESGNSSAAVGLATTSAVVTSITCIIALDAVFAFGLAALGI